MRKRPSYAVLATVLVAALTACGSESSDVATDDPTPAATSAAPSEETSASPDEPSPDEPSPEPSIDPDPAVVEGVDVAFDADALTVTMRVPELVASDRLLVMYRWQTRDVRVAIETTLVGDEPALNAVWTDYNRELSGKIRDVDADWDLDAGTVTVTLRERLNGTRAEVAALGLGPKDRYPVTPPDDAVVGEATRG